MPKWKIIAEYQPRSAPNRFLGSVVHKQGDSNPYTVHPEDVVEGIEVNDAWIKTHFDGVSPDEVYIQIPGHAAALDASLSPEPILPDEYPLFCDLVTKYARDIKTDRDYLMGVAYAETNDLKDMGAAGDGKVGPFQFTAAEWNAAITTGPAKDMFIEPEDRFSWREQPQVAALLLRDLVQRLQAANGNETPSRLEVYFAQKFGLGAEDVLKQPWTDRCRDRIKNTPAAGTYAAELANSDKTIQQALDDLRAPLESGFKAAYTLIDAQPPDIRFFQASDLPSTAGDSAPWLKVAIEEMNKGVTRDAGDKNTPEIEAYFKVTGTPDPDLHQAWCAAFVSFCMKNCGVEEVQSSIVSSPAIAASWNDWGNLATVPHPMGCVVVLKPVDGHGHVGFLWEGSNEQTIQLLGGNQKKGGEDHNHVGVVPFPADRVAEGGYRWLEVAQPAAAAGPGVDTVARSSDEAVRGRCTNIFATTFGGDGDTQRSAYGGMVNPHALEVALPARVPADKRQIRVRVANPPGDWVECRVNDVGPWNTRDKYWESGARPMAEAQKDSGETAQNGSVPSNHAGIDLTPAVFEALRISDNTRVDWEFV
jgi:uncharacterized protein (TIGR02594 family)